MASIFLAVGHGVSTDGNWDSGCVDGNYTEADLMFAIARVAVSILRNHGVDVYSDVDTGNDRNCTYTIRDANNIGVDCYVSLHCDYNKAPSGTLPIIYPGSDSGMRLAQCINNSYMARTGLTCRDILQRDDMEVANTDMPACIFETGSIRYDINILNNPDLAGKGIAFGILDYFGIGYSDNGTPVQPDPTPVIPSTPSNLSSGDVYDVDNIQYFCNICNYGAPDIDDEWGPETESCVMNAQRAYNIDVDGEWGPITETNAMNQVRSYQTRLNELGYHCDIDGIAGPETFNAVKAFQADRGLEADGIVGEQTFPLLFKQSSTSNSGNVSSNNNSSNSMIGLNWNGIDPNNLPNFEQDEFTCDDGCGGTVVDDLKVVAQLIRNKFGETVITSGARCPSQNAKEGGVSDSLHVPQNNSSGKSEAMDLYCSPMSDSKVDEIANFALSINQNIGVIRYYDRGSNRLFVHVQIGRRDTVGN